MGNKVKTKLMNRLLEKVKNKFMPRCLIHVYTRMYQKMPSVVLKQTKFENGNISLLNKEEDIRSFRLLFC